MKLAHFDYSLPKELIAQYPLTRRDACRLLVLNRKKETIEHRSFRDITEYFNRGDLLVLNDTKVLPSRLIGKRLSGGRVEVLLLGNLSRLTFKALLKPRRLKVGEKIIFNGGEVSAKIVFKDEISFSAKDIDAVYALGAMPLPPYIKRNPEEIDSLYYQTVYAKKEGAIASPTAGLHFTEEFIEEIESSGIDVAYLTLHVGVGTFKPVRVDDITRHRMEPEEFMIPERTIKSIEKARLEGARIIAVGTTSLRALESFALGAKGGLTELFIYPGYKFNIADCLLTNLHLPRTTLFMLVCAFAGIELIKKAYQEAIAKKYRFYSYGDAMLII